VYGVWHCTLSARSDPHKEFGGKNVLAEVPGVVSSGKAPHPKGKPASVAQSEPGCKGRVW
jgi:hypothetical protein